MKGYTREDMLRESGVLPEELSSLEARGLLVPSRHWRPFGKRQEYYTQGQLDVLRWILKTRRAVEASRRMGARPLDPGLVERSSGR